ncbi:MAG: 16S rRNA (guanine(966)-N(2))-methyltransferase RsmD [Chlamydiae bacterium]|nr:16S rRNA (guanine(966)-N(2))-methyltransferase RsmD [Chlamydiota bacterium]
MTLRIISGRFKGRLLKTPKSAKTRPTAAITRAAVFNICQNQIEGASFLDLFAGSGAMGFEALSRGASHVTFVEKNPQALRAIRENIATLKVESETTLIPFDLKLALSKFSKTYDLIYLDPPYDTPTAPIVEALLSKSLFAPNALLFIEEEAPGTPSQFLSLSLLSTRQFGSTLLHQYQWIG